MAFRLAVANIVDVPVRLTVTDAGRARTFSFNLLAHRLAQDELRSMTGGDDDRTVAEFLQERVTGWRGQDLVVDDDGVPAAFSAEAFGCMLGLVGVAGVCFTAYLEACGARGKAKN